MARIAFTDIGIRNLKPPAKGQADFWDEKLPSFGCRISQGGSKTFILKRNNARITIGKFGVLTLSEARTQAKRLLAEFTLGKVRPNNIPYRQAITLFLADKEKNRRAITVHGYRKLLTSLPYRCMLSEISHDDIARKLAKITGLQQHNHTLVALKVFFNWCIARRYLTENPTDGLSQHRTFSRSRVLTDNELKAVWKAAEKTGGQFGTIVHLLVLTGQRRSEISGLRADFCSITQDPNLSTITFPKEFTKNSQEHTIPLGPMATSLLISLKTDHQLLFPGRGQSDAPFNGWSKSKKALDTIAKIEPWTLHDLRRTFATDLAELGVAPHVIERLLNHVTGTISGVAAIYNRNKYEKETREAIELWENRLQIIIV